MKIGIVGLGRMGMGIALRLLDKGHKVVAWNRSYERTAELVVHGAQAAKTIEDLAATLDLPRTVWVMLPAGEVTEHALGSLAKALSRGDAVIEGGNSFYKDDLRRTETFKDRGIEYLDVGVSGGIWGREKGFCLMVGGRKEVFTRHEPIFADLAPSEGYLHCGPAGAGHFVKMVHNGIEYAMLQALGEGFGLLEASSYGRTIDFARVAHLWNQGSVIRSWILELAERAFAEDRHLVGIKGFVEDSGEGRWTVHQALESGVPVPAIAASLFARFHSRQEDAISDRFIAAMRKQFGGHPIQQKK